MSERVDRLEARRAHLEKLLGYADDGSKASALSRELRALDVEIAELKPSEARSTVDDLAAKRKTRLSGSAGVDAPVVRQRGGRRGGDRPS